MQRNAQGQITAFEPGDRIVFQDKEYVLGPSSSYLLNFTMDVIREGAENELKSNREVSVHAGDRYAKLPTLELLKSLNVDMSPGRRK